MTRSALIPKGLLLLALAAPRIAAADEPIRTLPPPLFPAAPQFAVGPNTPTVHVHLNVSRPVTLEILSPEATQWLPVCVAPCDAEVPLQGVFRVADRGMLSSGTLELEAAPGDTVTLDVTVRTQEQHQTARHLTIASYIAAAVGLGLEIGALSVDSSSDAQPALLWSGVGVAAVAIACTISSYILGEQTSLSQGSVTPAGKVATSPWTRLPVWKAPDATAAATPAPPSVTLFGTRF